MPAWAGRRTKDKTDLAAGGISFLAAQALSIGLQLLYPLAMAFLLLGAAPIGWQLLKRGQWE